MATLTTNQIKSLVYNAIGRASETANVAFNMLVVAKAGISGYSIGALQTDFTANNAAGWDLIAQYQAWAAADEKLPVNKIKEDKDLIILGNLTTRHEKKGSDAISGHSAGRYRLPAWLP